MRVSANYRYGTDLQLKVTYGDEADVQMSLKTDNICVRFLCSYVVVSVVTSRIGSCFVMKGKNILFLRKIRCRPTIFGGSC